MEPRIQYAKTSDGVRIAFTVVGQGPPLVTCGDIADAHAQLMWEHSSVAPLYKRLATRYSVVKYDPRGFGLSDRTVADFSLGARVADVEAVVEQLHLVGFSLLGFLTGGTTAIACAARYPESVRRLALVGSWPRTAEMLPLHRATAAASLLRTDWEMYLHVLAAANTGFGNEEAGRVAEFLTTAMERTSFVGWLSGMSTDDVSDLLRDIACPTLIEHYSGLTISRWT
jgi:pimeloyl-ACP methyl ester carboxylesterase